MLEVGLKALQFGFGAYGILYIVSALVWPEFFLQHIVPEAHRRPEWQGGVTGDTQAPWLIGVRGVMTIVGLAVVGWHAVYPIVDIVPQDWGYDDADEAWTSARSYLQGGAAFLTIALIGPIGHAAELLFEAQQKRRTPPRL